MENIPVTEAALIIRTDFSDQAAWESLIAVMREPADPFIFNLELLEDRDHEGATVEQLLAALPEDYPHTFLIVADKAAISQEDYPLLVVDLLEERGRQFRAIAVEVPAIDNNLSIANMGFADFADLVDETGVYRGMPEV